VILGEGLFDYAVFWQAGFHNLTCSLGTHLNADQFRQLCNRPRTVYLTFDVDANQSGRHAALQGGEMVSNEAVENLEWAGRGIPGVYHRLVFGCGATRANSRSVGKPSFGGYFPLFRDPRVAGIDSHKPASVLIVNLPEQRFVFLRKWHRQFHRKWVYTNTAS
jgi:hypothetical protein